MSEELWNVFRAIWFRGQSDCRTVGVTIAQARVMAGVGMSGSIPPSELARDFGLTRQALSSAVNHLEAHGMVTRSHSPTDRRRVGIAFTPKGRRLFDRLQRRQHAIHDQVNRLFPGPRRADAIGVLRTISEGVAGPNRLTQYRCALCAGGSPRRN